ncbi:MAG TPA: DUF3943 domain-containing protein [Nevskia sp.]|nr:DUF3943 domain-containing protein [Nevskia sp.]
MRGFQPAEGKASRHGAASGLGALLVLAGISVALLPPAVPAQTLPATAPAGDPVPPADGSHTVRLSWDTGEGKSYLIPLGEVIGFEFLLNQYDRNFIDRGIYGTSWSSIRRNFGSDWVIDTDPFQINQFMHPYQGSVFHGLARSSGQDFWTSMGYAFGGSLLWKEAGETDKPSINDQITTTFAGPFLGEPLFRMASLILEGGGPHPGIWRELGAAVISPTLGFNRLAFGERFASVFPSRDPAYFSRLGLGVTHNATVHSNIDLNAGVTSDEPNIQSLKRTQGAADFAFSYGLPGKPGYRYTRPFDYFNFEFSAVTHSIFENIFIRGLLYGTDYEAGDNYRGIWGLYGTYDYVAPQIYRVSNTAAALGNTGEWWLSRNVTLQSTVLGGVGFGAAGTIHGSGQRNYHYGATPEVLLSGRLTFGHRAQVDLTLRDWHVSNFASTEHRGEENIARGDCTFTLRVYGRNALALKYVASHRDADYPDLPNTHQTVGAISLFYTLLGDTGFGTVDWRKAALDLPVQPDEQRHTDELL